jgi:hypothetical protein
MGVIGNLLGEAVGGWSMLGTPSLDWIHESNVSESQQK